ncbi:MAG: winged helix-turn-helix transcriptional regulator, partial [Proteobacteria bacterium]|nr:winged helix-turn-helix transcriptional regulator [Pseudomonadota bacterium]
MRKRAGNSKGRADVDRLIAAAEDATRLLKAMASPVRLRMLCLLAEHEMPVGDIAERLGLREPATSQQLAQLRLEGLVTARRDAQRI